MEQYKEGEYGLTADTEGMWARTSEGQIGKIILCNDDEMILGPEIKVNDEIIMCIERDSIVDIKENPLYLLKIGDYINGERIGRIEQEDGEYSVYTGYCWSCDLTSNGELYNSLKETDLIVTKELFDKISAIKIIE